MNLEQKHPPSPRLRRTRKLYEQINKLEGLLTYAVQHDDVVEAARIREELICEISPPNRGGFVV